MLGNLWNEFEEVNLEVKWREFYEFVLIQKKNENAN
jgi:hypothetical protein